MRGRVKLCQVDLWLYDRQEVGLYPEIDVVPTLLSADNHRNITINQSPRTSPRSSRRVVAIQTGPVRAARQLLDHSHSEEYHWEKGEPSELPSPGACPGTSPLQIGRHYSHEQKLTAPQLVRCLTESNCQPFVLQRF